jgi:hypothetical protein
VRGPIISSSSTNPNLLHATGPEKQVDLFAAVLETMSSSDDKRLSDSDEYGVSAQAGSLAAAAGMVVDASSRAPPMHSTNPIFLHGTGPEKQVDLFAAVLETMSSSHDKSLSYSDEYGGSAQASSVTAAVGMVVDASSRAPPIRLTDANMLHATGAENQVDLFAAVRETLSFTVPSW